ncbi:PREDICTED: histidine-containing phosphotransfer protein 2-like isoform X4 [Theobroma cacao]|uniref:Histidine-containing phosphotransfer protein n=1 Tax=Theobroma cacao TaxID=3641 RepID=A0AB32WRY5_THECC|nr:PREDICTED: histidine-containing phosphotransfer protein 2-like isoform X4 [Theobroma cacao]
MAVPIQKVLLTGFIHSMHSEEIVDDQFYQPEAIKDPACLYCWRRGCIISLSDLPNVDFSNLAALATEIEERSSCIGAEHVRLTCLDLMRACDQMQKQKYETFFFCQALSWTKNEFAHTRNKLQVLVQMERKIMRLEAKQQK